MKKISILAAILIAFAFFSGCSRQYYDYDEMKESVEKVEIVEVRNYVWAQNLDMQDIIVKKALSSEETDELLIQLSKMSYVHPFGDPRGLHGICIKFFYKDNRIEILGSQAVRFYNAEGNYDGGESRSFRGDGYNDLISKFLRI
ncbi:MAG: hypothetical protein FWH03_03805 [Firmicutes bacterium]|nr:hypothetical protein [Bacillota bacterium]